MRFPAQKIIKGRAPQALLAMLLLTGVMLLPRGAQAQQEVIPSMADVAARIADPDTREDSLYTIVAMARFLGQLKDSGDTPGQNRLQEDLDWLNRLRSRYGNKAPRSPVLDPAAWLIVLELEQQELATDHLISPLGPGLDTYLEQVFDRRDERLAAAILPELLWRTEPLAPIIWGKLLEHLNADEELKSSMLDAPAQWLESWAGADAGIEQAEPSSLLAGIAESMDVLVQNAISSGPPDRERLYRIRHLLMMAMSGLDQAGQAEAMHFYRLAGMVDGLHERRYFSFADGLLALATSLLVQTANESQSDSVVAEWLSTNLPLISGHYAKMFSVVDPRLNSALAAAFDVVKDIARTGETEQDLITLHHELADAVAQLALLVPDLDYYFDLPVRDSIAGAMDACIGIMARREDDGSPAMTRDLYNDCQQSIVVLANTEARVPALSGDPDGPFGDDELERELTVTSGQRINYGIGYLHSRYTTGCEEPTRPLPNPLEWSALATLLTWFAGQSPVYFQTPENEARLLRMREIGNELLREVAGQVDCFAGAGALVNDPVSRSLVDYRDALVALSSGINGVIFDFRGKSLAAGADIALQRGASQSTAYRPDDLLIGPCDPENTCEMAGTLTSTRALLGLFPEQYLVADQSGLGNVEICYDRMAWVNRRSEPVRADDTNVANYFGYLEFNLVGRYRVDGSVNDIFGFRFTSPQEEHYLFAAATDEVLEDSCPVEWIGQRIVTPLRQDRNGIVPNRLTYLAAPRMQPSRVLANNWDRGAEWRDWFITGIGVKRLELEPPSDISGELNQHLQKLHRSEQAAIFQSILRPETRSNSSGIDSLFEETARLNTIKSLIRHQFMVFYPQLLNESDELRSAIAGQGGLLDMVTLARFRADNVPVHSLNRIAFERLEQVQREWQNQPEATRRTGSIAGSLAHAMMRLNALYETFFAEPPLPVSPATP